MEYSATNASSDGSLEDVNRLQSWSQEHLGRLHEGPWEWHALPGDAGFRRYFRLESPVMSLIAALSPPKTEKNDAFFAIASFLHRHDVQVPKIHAHDMAHGFFLLEDLGSTLYLDHLNNDSVNGLYTQAMSVLLKIQRCPLDTSVFPEYDRPLLDGEMRLFPEWFVGHLLGHELSSAEQALIDQTLGFLVDSAMSQPQVVVHRDYHSRNLVYMSDGAPGVIDFQDAVVGPITYDLVSLLRDCYIAWPQGDVERWVLRYRDLAQEQGLIQSASAEQFLTWFDLMGLQRHIKVLGIFARLSLRDGKHRYLEDLPLVIQYVTQVSRRYDTMHVFADWFEDTLLPLIQQQPWMRSL